MHAEIHKMSVNNFVDYRNAKDLLLGKKESTIRIIKPDPIIHSNPIFGQVFTRIDHVQIMTSNNTCPICKLLEDNHV